MSDARIIDSGYRRYDGARLGAQHATVALWKHTLRRILGLGRPARWKALPVLAIAIAYVPNIVFVGVTAIVPDDRIRNSLLPGYAFTYGFITAAIALFVVFVAPEALCPDRRSGILSLYLATPLTRSRYIAAKAAAVFTSLLLVTLGPPLLYLIGLSAQNAGPHGLAGFLGTLGRIALSGVILAAFFTGLSVGASSLTDRKAFAAAGIFFFSQVVGAFVTIIVDVAKGPSWILGFSTNAAVFSLVLHIFGQGRIVTAGGDVVPMAAFAAGTAFWTVLGGAIAWWRYARLRVTR
ncbi:MAG: type transport system permease protein [Actinomycetota bacterium]|jgi:ABC-2 type transport system permease protein